MTEVQADAEIQPDTVKLLDSLCDFALWRWPTILNVEALQWLASFRLFPREFERISAEGIGAHADVDDRMIIQNHVVRVEVQSNKLFIELAGSKRGSSRQSARSHQIEIPWKKISSKRRHEILIPQSQVDAQVRPIRSENRATLVASIARGRRWLDEIITSSATNVDAIAERERCTARHVNMTISLAFLAPDLVKAAIQGKLPYGMGVRRLRDLPCEWQRQRHALGL